MFLTIRWLGLKIRSCFFLKFDRVFENSMVRLERIDRVFGNAIVLFENAMVRLEIRSCFRNFDRVFGNSIVFLEIRWY